MTHYSLRTAKGCGTTREATEGSRCPDLQRIPVTSRRLWCPDYLADPNSFIPE